MSKERVRIWEALLEAGVSLKVNNLQEEIKKYPLRKDFRPTVPDIVKPSLRRQLEEGLVYIVTEDVERDRTSCGLDPKPPTAHLFKEALERERKILEASSIMKSLGYEKGVRKFKY
ncbi:MAG: hdrC-like protein [Candidatus Methanomethylicaceae archaeon]